MSTNFNFIHIYKKNYDINDTEYILVMKYIFVVNIFRDMHKKVDINSIFINFVKLKILIWFDSKIIYLF